MKNIILFGRTGTGKSTLGNMLLQGCLKSRGDNAFKCDDGAIGVTLKCSVKSNSDYNIYDTVGLGETEHGGMSDEKAKQHIYEYLTDIKTKFDHICIVTRKDRISNTDFAVLKAAQFIFDGAFENAVLIVTHTNNAWIKYNNDLISKLYGNMSRIAVDFPPIDSDPTIEKNCIVRREGSLRAFERFLQSNSTNPLAPKVCFLSDTKRKESADKLRSFFVQVFAFVRTLTSIALLALSILGAVGVL